MPKGKKKGPDLTHMQVYIPTQLANKVELLLLDPVRMRGKYGAKSALITRLLSWWVKEQEGKNDVQAITR